MLLVDIQEKLERLGSPEQILERAKLDKLYSVSFKTIYRAIKKGFLLKDIVKLLPRKGKVKRSKNSEKRGRILGKRMIEERPQEADDRSEIGHYESDTIIGKGHKGAIMTYVCRKTRFLIAELMLDRKAETFNDTTMENFKYIPEELIKTFTKPISFLEKRN